VCDLVLIAVDLRYGVASLVRNGLAESVNGVQQRD
jgi:hypothetical protein